MLKLPTDINVTVYTVFGKQYAAVAKIVPYIASDRGRIAVLESRVETLTKRLQQEVDRKKVTEADWSSYCTVLRADRNTAEEAADTLRQTLADYKKAAIARRIGAAVSVMIVALIIGIFYPFWS